MLFVPYTDNQTLSQYFNLWLPELLLQVGILAAIGQIFIYIKQNIQGQPAVTSGHFATSEQRQKTVWLPGNISIATINEDAVPLLKQIFIFFLTVLNSIKRTDLRSPIKDNIKVMNNIYVICASVCHSIPFGSVLVQFGEHLCRFCENGYFKT